MQKYISRKESEKRVLDSWENEGGRVSTDEMNLNEINLPSKSERKKDLHGRSANAGSALSSESESDPVKACKVTQTSRKQSYGIYSEHIVYC